ncbi:MAG: flagellar biosynthesis protein FlhA [Alphaproteobacteria bacterium]
MSESSLPAPSAGSKSDDARAGFMRILRLAKGGDVVLALGLVCILVVLILPMPTWLLDIALAISITLGVLILMTSLFIAKPLEFSSFPTVLLIATLLRLSLNLASTRLILSDGHEGPGAAGHVIEAFGSFVMSGNFVIGIVVFAILVIVNFVVITKGSGRIAEVSARFTLDAMPGKQMAIDADLSAGLIDETQARDRRKALEDESNFFGAMDGASKFVRGDAVAGLMITVINIVGGIIIGTAQKGLTMEEAAQSYTLLTVGDGLVSQIPALVVSVAAGLLVSKSNVAGSADKAVFAQLSGYPRALGLCAVLMLAMSLLPGIPMLPFLAMAGATGGIAYVVDRRRNAVVAAAAMEEAKAVRAVPPVEEPITTALHMDLIRLELGFGLLQLINGPAGQRLTDQIKSLRRQLASEMGFVMPAVRIQDNLQLAANDYSIRIKEIEAGRGELRPNMLLVMDPRGEEIPISGDATREPTFGLPAKWIGENNREEALFRGYTVVDPATVVTTHLTELIKDNMADLLSFAESRKLLDEISGEHKKLIEDLIPSQVSTSVIQRIMQGLLRERVSVRDLPTILEAVAEAAGHTRNVLLLTEHVRGRLARQLCDANLNHDNVLPIVTMSPDWERAFAEALVGQGEERQLAMAPTRLQEFIARVRQIFEHQAMLGETPVLLTSPAIRPYVRSIVERFRPITVVMSQNEIHPKAKIRTVGQV